MSYTEPGFDPIVKETLGVLGDSEGEVKTTSSTGGQKGVKEERYSLIPIGPLAELAKLYGRGAKKYDSHQWRNGYEWSKSYDALQRHAQAFWSGEDLDTCESDSYICVESREGVDWDGPKGTCWVHTGSHHMAAVAWHAFALMEFFESHPDHDDRYIEEES